MGGRAVGLVSEALRGEGALLYLPGINGQPGERFMLRHDPRAELAPRDIVAAPSMQRCASMGCLMCC